MLRKRWVIAYAVLLTVSLAVFRYIAVCHSVVGAQWCSLARARATVTAFYILCLNVIGLGLGTVFRFWSYRKWVFPAQADEVEPIEDRAPSPLV